MVPTKVTCIISQLTGGGGEVGFSGLGDFPSSSFPMDKHQCRNSQLIEDAVSLVKILSAAFRVTVSRCDC